MALHAPPTSTAPISGNGAAVTTSTPLLNLTQTWNSGAAAFTALKLNVTDSGSASGSLMLDLQANASSVFSVDKAGQVLMGSNLFAGQILAARSAAGAIQLGSPVDVILTRDAANTLALRNGASAQTLNLYRTYTDAANYERLNVAFSSGDVYLYQQAAGTGATHGFYFGTTGPNVLGLQTNSTTRWLVDAAGNFIGQAAGLYVKTPGTTVAALPAAASAGAGARSFVTDANATTFAAIVAGGGANGVPVYCDGTNWRIG